MVATKLRRLFTNPALITFTMGHFTVDMFSGLLPVLYPIMSKRFDLSNADIGFIALAYTAASSLSQPLFGYLADRYGSRNFAVASLVWSASMVGLAGLAPTYPALLAFAMLAGLGSGAYHPQGASNAAASVGDARRNTAMSAYTVGGTGGYSLGPLIGAALFALFGGYGTLVLAPFGFIVAYNMLRQLRRLGLGLAQRHANARAEQRAIPWRLLAPVMIVVMLRSWVSLSVVSFIPIWFEDQGRSSGFYSVLTTCVLAAGAVGTLVGGLLADRIGQRVVLGVSLAAAIPSLLLFAALPGTQSLVFGPLFGFWSDMGLSITLVIAQRLLPGRVGVASGFILGMGFVTGGIGVPVTGALADRVGVGHALMLTSLLIVAAALLVTRIPRAALQPGAALPTVAVEVAD
jgi:FSR family fosmidomycin resistance protein-like MFS transporter